MSQATNPYAPPAARVDDEPDPNPEATAIRRAHIGAEVSLRTIGVLYYLGGALFIVLAIFPLFATRGQSDGLGIAAALLAFGGGQIAGGWALRGLRPWGRVVAGLVSLAGLLVFPLGTAISACTLYLLLSKKGGTIFTRQYKDVIAATPHVKYQTPIASWVVLALVLGWGTYAIYNAYFG